MNTRLYFFGAEGVDFKRKTMTGIRYNSRQRRWEKKTVRLPDVLYVRGGSSASVRRVARRMDRMGIPKINALVRFSKSELFEKLQRDERIRPYLPFTIALRDLQDARQYVRKLGKVYIKAIYGRKGTKVMRVVKRSSGYHYSYAVIDRLVRKKVRHFKDLKQHMKHFFGGRKLLVQEAVDVVRIGRRQAVDFRAELQRDGEGALQISGICMRVGRKGSPITTHNAAYKMKDHLQELFPHYTKKEIRDLKQRIEGFVILVHQAVEKCYGGFGELGIDFGVDKRGQIWLFECNAQSAKVSIRKAYGSHTRKKIYLNPLQYAKFLAKK
ncbi:YheC/YheD family protein [Cohnella pontilimi]|uniref:YheC/YheD family endospore coat-associated protein n=1 Tax=Cohnella pontilimi TaxID=2564100 RepID=UPI00145F8B01|nr:YheC/YheD family protein [Cohnella pontilimi]